MSNAANAFSQGHLQQSWHYLERAHILGQPYPFAHSYVHWKMLKFGFKTKNTKEIIGQIPRLVFGGLNRLLAIFRQEIRAEQMFPCFKRWKYR